MADETYAVENGWLVERVNKHTCGTGPDGYYGAHEPGCGSVPIERVETLLKHAAALERVRALADEWEQRAARAWSLVDRLAEADAASLSAACAAQAAAVNESNAEDIRNALDGTP